MSRLAQVLKQRRAVLTVAVLLAVWGALSWARMPRQEDPRLPQRWAMVVTPYPGASAEQVERLVLEPLEEQLAEVAEIKRLQATARSGAAIVNIELQDHIQQVTPIWDKVARALDRAQRQFPEGVPKPTLDRHLQDQESVVVAITGASDPLVLLNAARRLRKRLLALRSVSKVKVLGDPGEQLTIRYDDAVARRLGVTPTLLAAQLRSRNTTLPGGTLKVGGQQADLRPATEFSSLEQLRRTPIVLRSGAAVPLHQLARVSRQPAEPASQKMRYNGQLAVGLGIVPRPGINVVRFGAEVKQALARARHNLSPLKVETAIFQPARVERRLDDLSTSLLLGILIVAGVLLLFMGARLGAVVTVVVPLVAFAALAIYAAGGGVLHQISIAALVLSLGILVDNAIVMAENVQRRMDEGARRDEAMTAAVRELGWPLGSATATTVAAFIPMLLSEGDTGDFTRSIPTVLIITLVISYLFAITVTPILVGLVLRRRKTPQRSARRFAGALARFALRRRGWILAGALVLLGLSAFGATRVNQQFFPLSDRNQLVVDLELPEGAHISRTDAAARRLERALASRPDVLTVATYVGRGVPHFYYNLQARPSSPHLAQLVVTTRSTADLAPLQRWLLAAAQRLLPGVRLKASRIEQGPPVRAPVEVRLYGDDLGQLQTAAEQVMAAVRSTPGTRSVASDMSMGVPQLRLAINDAAAGRHGLSRRDVAVTLYGRTRGLEVGKFRAGDDPVPIVVRSSRGEQVPPGELAALAVSKPGGPPVPLGQLARQRVAWRPAVIRHRNRRRVVTVTAQLAPTVVFGQVLKQLQPKLTRLSLPQGITLEQGGQAEGSGDANRSLMRALPIGLLVLVLVLLLQFNSFRRVGIIMLTVPLAATGVIPGLLLSGQPFGFMSLLGVFALIGIVVNNAIVLIDLIELLRRRGAPLRDAIREAVTRRTRPILLTVATTVAGLLPLALSSSPLWPPLAWAIISGLLASTGLTLLVVPALYSLLFRDPRPSPLRFFLPGAGELVVGSAFAHAMGFPRISAHLQADDLQGGPHPAFHETTMQLGHRRKIRDAYHRLLR